MAGGRQIEPERTAFSQCTIEIIFPPIECTSSLDNAKPIPVPSIVPCSRPRRLKGSNTFSIFSSEIQLPVSVTLNLMQPSPFQNLSVTCPFSSLYLIAFESKFRRTCERAERSARTGERTAEPIFVSI